MLNCWIIYYLIYYHSVLHVHQLDLFVHFVGRDFRCETKVTQEIVPSSRSVFEHIWKETRCCKLWFKIGLCCHVSHLSYYCTRFYIYLRRTFISQNKAVLASSTLLYTIAQSFIVFNLFLWYCPVYKKCDIGAKKCETLTGIFAQIFLKCETAFFILRSAKRRLVRRVLFLETRCLALCDDSFFW